MKERVVARPAGPGRGTARVIALAAGAFYLLVGAWAFLAPVSFFHLVASFPPYNHHLFHDAGAFQVGLGLTLLLSAIRRTALQPALLAVLAASLLHLASHVEDRALGGQASDLAILGLLCVLLAAAWVLERRAGTPTRVIDARAIRQAER